MMIMTHNLNYMIMVDGMNMIMMILLRDGFARGGPRLIMMMILSILPLMKPPLCSEHLMPSACGGAGTWNKFNYLIFAY